MQHRRLAGCGVEVIGGGLKTTADGLDVVLATSCSIIGPNDFLPSRMGKTLCDFANGKLWAYPPGGFEFIRAGDCVQGHILAIEKGRAGQKYIFHTERHRRRFRPLADALVARLTLVGSAAP